MPRLQRRSIDDVQREFPEDFTVVNGSLLLCKFCDAIVKWRKKTRVLEHLATRMHKEGKEAKLQKWNSMADLDEEDDSDEGGANNNNNADGPQYCLRWNNHQNNLVSVFSRLLGEEQFTDCLLAVDGRKIRAHKLVLSACSSYFENLFTSFDEKNQIVVLKDTRFSDVYYLLEFMYKGEINVPQDQLSSLLRTAENLQIRGLAVEGKGGGEEGGHELRGRSTPPPPSKHQAEVELPMARNNNSERSTTKDVAAPPPAKKKRGRPRILDKEEPAAKVDDDEGPSPQRQPHYHPTAAPGSAINEVAERLFFDVRARNGDVGLGAGNAPTPGGPLTEDRIKKLGVIKLNDYLTNGTRPQFWDEHYVKVIMHAVRNKEIDVKGAAELLGVSYGTLYGRYRELFGYVKHAWNMSGRPIKAATSLLHQGTSAGNYSSSSTLPYATREPQAAVWTDPGNQHVFDQLKSGALTVGQAAEMTGLEPAVLAFQLIGKVPTASLSSASKWGSVFGEEMIAAMMMENGMMAAGGKLAVRDDDEEDVTMEIQPDIDLGEESSPPPPGNDREINKVKLETRSN